MNRSNMSRQTKRLEKDTGMDEQVKNTSRQTKLLEKDSGMDAPDVNSGSGVRHVGRRYVFADGPSACRECSGTSAIKRHGMSQAIAVHFSPRPPPTSYPGPRQPMSARKAVQCRPSCSWASSIPVAGCNSDGHTVWASFLSLSHTLICSIYIPVYPYTS